MTTTHLDRLCTAAIARLISHLSPTEKDKAIRDEAERFDGMPLSGADVLHVQRLLDDPTAVLHRERNHLLNEVWSILNGEGSAADKLYYLEESLPAPARPSLAVVSSKERRASVWMACKYNGAVWTITGVDEDDEVVYLTSAGGVHILAEFRDVCPDPDLGRPHAA